MKPLQTLRVLLLLGSSAACGLAFQNCAPSFSASDGLSAQTSDASKLRLSSDFVSMESASRCSALSFSKTHLNGAVKGYLASSEPLRGSDLDYLIAKWKERIGTGVNYASESNRAVANMGNTEGEFLSSYLDMYRATLDFYYLERFIEQADLVISLRDDKTGARDYSGNQVAAWSTYHKGYVSDSWRANQKGYAFLVESGNLTYPIADFAQMVLRGPDCLKEKAGPGGQKLKDIAARYVSEVEKTYGYHQATFSADTVSGLPIGWFNSRGDIGDGVIGIKPGVPYPLNYQTSFGRTLVALWLATNNPSYRDMAVRIGNMVLLDMAYKASGSNDWYEWSYWPQMAYYSSYIPYDRRPEDNGHATITFEFAALMNKYVGVFGATEMGRLARTFTLRVYAGASSRYGNLDGSDLSSSPTLLANDGVALPYAPYAPSDFNIPNVVYDSLINILALHHETINANSVKSYAQLLRHYSERFQLEGQPMLASTALGRSGPGVTSATGKTCPWGGSCRSDADCLSSQASDFTAYNAKVTDNSCYSLVSGTPIFGQCLRDGPTAGWIGDYWAYDFTSSSSAGIACDSRSSSVWTWSSSQRTLSYCARKYKCQ